jgi:hypothetical protein
MGCTPLKACVQVKLGSFAPRASMETSMKTFLRAAALAVAVVAAAAQIAFAETLPAAAFQATTLNLTASGEVMATPDKATITLGVQTEAASAAQALQANAEQMTRVMASLKRAGVADRDLQTAQLNVNPKYAYEPNQPPRLTGYEASNQVMVTVRDLKRLGAMVDAAVAAGATNVNSIAFGLVDPKTAEDAARLEAVKALQAKADLYAKAVGHPVMRLISLSEGVGYAPPVPMPEMMVAGAKRMAATPVSIGEMRVRIEVTGLYELAR